MDMFQVMQSFKRRSVAWVTAAIACGLTAPLHAQDKEGRPLLQLDFLDVIETARQGYAAGQTDLQKGAVRPARANALCALLGGQRIEGWVGMVETLTTNNAGRGVISIDVGQKVHLMTHNNAFSDYGHDTMLDPTGRLFTIASNLRKGDKVVVTGGFLRSDKDCLMEVSLTMAGSIREPWFIFRFTDIVKR
jgi:colicin import membrane protein